jgi:DNA repair photolyase
MNDPYMPVEKEYRLVQGALKIIREHGFPIHILTKSDLVVRDWELIQEIGQLFAAISFTITTANDNLAAKLEPGASRPSARFRAMEELAGKGIMTGVTMMPVLPFVEDKPENIQQIVRQAGNSGASYIIPAFGVTLRQGSREYFYQKLDLHFPGIKEKYIQAFGNSYQCGTSRWADLNRVFQQEMKSTGMESKTPVFKPRRRTGSRAQLPLFEN